MNPTTSGRRWPATGAFARLFLLLSFITASFGMVAPASAQVDTIARGLAIQASTPAKLTPSLGVMGVLKRTTIPKVALLGDSRTWDAHLTNVTSYGNTFTQNYGLAYQLTMMTGGRVDFPQRLNFGVGGITTGLITTSTFSQLATGFSPQIPAVANFPNLTPLQAAIQSDADIVIYMCGTNDRTVGGGVAASVTQANDKLIITALQHAGKIVIVLTDLPRGDATYVSNRLLSSQLDYHFDTAQWIRSIRMPGVYVADVFAALADPASTLGDDIVGSTFDGLHWSFAGQYMAASIIAPIINNLFPPVNRLRSSNTDMFSANNPHGALTRNPMVEGTGTSLPTYFTASLPTGVTATYSYVIGSRGENRFQVTLSGTPTAGATASFSNLIPAVNVAAGDVLQSFGDLQVAAGGTGYNDVRVDQVLWLPNNSNILDLRSFGSANVTPAVSPPTTIPGGTSGAYGGTIVTEPSAPVPSAIGSLSNMQYRVDMTVGTPINLTFSFGPSDTRKVNVGGTISALLPRDVPRRLLNDNAAERLAA